MLSVKREGDGDIDCQEEENSVTKLFPTIKSEENEVSYITVCPLLDVLCQYPEMLAAFHHLHISVDLSKCSIVVNGNFFLLLECVKHL
jgi:hypothetical protein